MKAWAAISAAAVLVALPVSVQQAAGAVPDPAVAPAELPAAAVASGASAADLGVVLWLAVAVVAALAALVVLRRGRTAVVAVGAPAEVLAPVVPLTATIALNRPERSGTTSNAAGR
jgi:hypothetical protein